ncbi:MAG: insulinase family protein [Deltaproteobacteria bacterium]|nr:insulinase family protein [Deltaproteobacteria bacterium]
MSRRRISASRADICPLDAVEATLPNGLHIIVVPIGQPGLVVIETAVQVGPRDDLEPGRSGFAHFTEHLVWKGSRRYSGEIDSQILMKAGARRIALTTPDCTRYGLICTKADLEALLEVEGDRVMHPWCTEDAFVAEAATVLAELKRDAADPISAFSRANVENAFEHHPYRYQVLGRQADVEGFPALYAYAAEYHRRHYRPERTTLLVVGDVNPDLVIAGAERHWGSWEPGTEPRPTPFEPRHTAPAVAQASWPTEIPTLFGVGFRGPAFDASTRDAEALDALLDLAFGEGSDLERRLMRQQQLVDVLSPVSRISLDPDVQLIMGRMSAESTPESTGEAIDAVLETVAALRRGQISESRLARWKSRNQARFVHVMDNAVSICTAIGDFLHVGRSFSGLNEHYRRRELLTPEDLHDVAGRYFTDENLVCTVMSHEEQPAALEAARRGVNSRVGHKVVLSLAAKTVHLKSELPLVRFKLAFDAGSAYDPPGKAGLATLTAGMLASAGSRELSSDEIGRTLHGIAGYFVPNVDRELSTLTGVVHRDHADELADVALRQLLEPGMREEDFELLREAQKAALLYDLRDGQDEGLALERLQCNVFAGTPYGHPSLGTLAGLDSLTLEDVQGFASSFYTRRNLTVGLAGNYAPAFEERLLRELEELPDGERPSPPMVEVERPRGLRVEILEKESEVVAIALGLPMPVLRAHPDFAALAVARAVLGDHRTSFGRLFRLLRTARGLTYGAYAYTESIAGSDLQSAYSSASANTVRRTQLFQILIRPVRRDSAVFALKAALHELERLIDGGVSAEELDTFRTYLSRSVHQLRLGQDDQLGSAIDDRWFGLEDHVRDLLSRLERLTPDAVNEAIRRHLSATQLDVVMTAGNAEGLKQELLAPGVSGASYDAPRSAEVAAEDRIIGARILHLTEDQVRITHVEEVFAA